MNATMVKLPAQLQGLLNERLSEEELLSRLQETRGLLWSFLNQRLSRQADVEDVMQETWIRAQRAWPRYREQGYFRAWLLRIAYRECCRYQRKHHPETADRLPEAADVETPARKLQRQERVEQVHAAIQELPVQFREAVWLRIVEELPFKEIAYILRCPENTAVTRTRRGLQHLRTRLQEEM